MELYQAYGIAISPDAIGQISMVEKQKRKGGTNKANPSLDIFFQFITVMIYQLFPKNDRRSNA